MVKNTLFRKGDLSTKLYQKPDLCIGKSSNDLLIVFDNSIAWGMRIVAIKLLMWNFVYEKFHSVKYQVFEKFRYSGQ